MSHNAQRVPSTAQLEPVEQFWSDLHGAPTRRKDPRVHANVPVLLIPNKGPGVELHSNDLSYHGMQVRCDRNTAVTLRPHSRGEDAHPVYPATLQLDIDGISLRVNAEACIAHVTLTAAPPETEVAIGMTFVSFADGAQQTLKRFIDQHMLPAGWP